MYAKRLTELFLKHTEEYLTTSFIANEVGSTPSKIKHSLRALVNAGVLVRRSKGYYKLRIKNENR